MYEWKDLLAIVKPILIKHMENTPSLIVIAENRRKHLINNTEADPFSNNSDYEDICISICEYFEAYILENEILDDDGNLLWEDEDCIMAIEELIDQDKNFNSVGLNRIKCRDLIKNLSGFKVGQA